MLAEPLAQRVRGVEGLVGAELGAHDLDERHERRRVEEVHADDALRRGRRGRDLGHRERGRVRREHRIGTADARELGEELLLGGELLDDRLDDEVAVGEIGELSRRRQEREVERLDLSLLHLAREEVADAVARLLAQVRGDLPADRFEAGLDAQLRDARAHRPETHDADFHARDPNRGPSTTMTAPATASSPSAPLSPTPRAAKPMTGPFIRPPV